MSRQRLPGLALAAWTRLSSAPQAGPASRSAAATTGAAAAAAAAAHVRFLSAAAASPSPPAAASAAAAASPSTSDADNTTDPGADDAVYGGQTLAAIRARIFGTHIGDGRPSGRKLLRKPLIGPAIAAYYPPDPAALDPLFVDVEDTRRVAKLERMRRRGKAPPKKGEGKRAGKKKR